MKTTVEGVVHTWDVGGEPRRFTTLVVPFSTLQKVARAQTYSAQAGGGWSKTNNARERNGMVKKMEKNDFCPSPMVAHLNYRQTKTMVLTHDVPGDRNSVQRVRVEVDDADPMDLTDGNLRYEALLEMYNGAFAANDSELMDMVAATPIVLMVLVDGDAQLDHVRLQLGRRVDANHVHALNLSRNRGSKAAHFHGKKAAEVAKRLHTDKRSVLHTQLRLGGVAQSTARLNVKDLTAAAPGGLPGSFLGLVACTYESGARMADKASMAADIFMNTVDALRAACPDLLAADMPLDATADKTAANVTLLTTVATCMAYRLRVTRPQPTWQGAYDDLRVLNDADKEALKEAAAVAFSEKIGSKPKAKDKAALARAFAERFFADVECERHDGIPRGLIELTGHSGFAAEKLPPKKKSRREAREEAYLAA